MPRSLNERANNIPRADFLRAYALIEGEDRARTIVTGLFDDLASNPEKDVALDPAFIALLALFSDSGRELATALLAPEEIRFLQREMARRFPAVRADFPHVLREGTPD